MNVKLLKQIQREIRKEPRRLNMYSWIETSVTGPCAPPCRTTACIAGWATVLSHKYGKKLRTFKAKVNHLEEVSAYFQREAEDALDLTGNEATRLFHVSSWPMPYRDQYLDAEGDPKLKAKVTCERIDHFIKTEGED